jgi:hypothetical protein
LPFRAIRRGLRGMGGFNVPSGHVFLRDVFHKMAVSEAIEVLGNKYPSISKKTKETISNYRRDFLEYERLEASNHKARIQYKSVRKAKHAVSINVKSPPKTTNNKEPTKPIDMPVTRPHCPPEVRDFLNALHGIGNSIEECEEVVRQLIKTETLPVFMVQSGGLLQRLSADEIKSTGGLNSLFGQVVIGEADATASIRLRQSQGAYDPV